MNVFIQVIDYIFNLCMTIWNFMMSSWLIAVFVMILVLGFIVDLVINTRSQ